MEATGSCCGGTGEALVFTCAGAAYSGQVANRAAALAIVLLAVAIRLISPDPVVAPAASRILSRRNTLDSSRFSPVVGGGK